MNSFQNFYKRVIGTFVLCIVAISLKALNYEYREIIPGSRAVIDFPDGRDFSLSRKTRVIFFALPNGNTIEQSAGKILQPGDDWHYDIQHIAAQTKFIREHNRKYNYVVVYLEAASKAWTAYAAAHPDSPQLFRKMTSVLQQEIERLSGGKLPVGSQEIILASHSGGGRFVFNWIAGGYNIPSEVVKIAFLDSNYGFEPELFTAKIAGWLRDGKTHTLSVISYIDSTVILNGKHIVSSTGGTGYRSDLMYRELSKSGFRFKNSADTVFTRHNSVDGQIRIWIKENPGGQIYHTVLVERNGFIQSVLAGEKQEGKGYEFWGKRAYEPSDHFTIER